MKYIKNLIKRKKYDTLRKLLILVIITGILIIIPFIPYMLSKEREEMLNFGAIAVLVLIGISMGYIIATVLITDPDAQNEEDFEIIDEKDRVYIFYKKHKYYVKKVNFEKGIIDWKIKGANNENVGVIRAQQLYNYVKAKVCECKSNYDESPIEIPIEEIVNKFANVHLLSAEEKEEFLKENKKELRPYTISKPIIFYICGLFVIGIILIVAYIVYILNCMLQNNAINVWYIFAIFAFISAPIALAIGIMLFKSMLKEEKELFSKIQKDDLYVVNCQLCYRKIRRVAKGSVKYLSKVTDGNYVSNEWIPVSEKIYNTDDDVNLYILGKTGKDFMKII
ncbi:MAG: hypothetical protein IKP28_01815 [Clostridia bacterium]|nr:hypothetical protein [Clostridia bacterium]